MKTKIFYCSVDMSDCGEVINDEDKINGFIKSVANNIDMKILKGPISANGIPENPGITVFAIIDFSHISVHTFSKHNEAFVDIFSCKKFDNEKVIKMSKEFFGANVAKTSYFES